MNKVITINLNGKAYQLEEAGYEALRKYLDAARAALHEDPDKDEIMADLEAAVADKCDTCLKGAKNVVTAEEVAGIIAKMGPVEGKGAAAAGADANSAEGAEKSAAPKRLYRIVEGSIIRGVCTGLAAYFNIDVTLVRVLFVLLTIFTGGGWVLGYIVLTLVMPIARTADEVAQAHGETPFTAQDVIDRARGEYAKFAADHEGTKHEWKENLRAWRRKMRSERHAWRSEWRAEREKRHAEMRAERYGYGGPGHWIATAIGGIISFVIFIIFVVTVVSFLKYGLVFGHPFGAGHPLWVSLLFLFAIFWLISLPFSHMVRHAGCYGQSGHCHRHGGGLMPLIMLALLVYAAVALFPPVREVWQTVVVYLRSMPR